MEDYTTCEVILRSVTPKRLSHPSMEAQGPVRKLVFWFEKKFTVQSRGTIVAAKGKQDGSF